MQSKFFSKFLFVLAFFPINLSFSQQIDVYNFSANKISYSQDNSIIEATGNVVAKNNEGKQISADKIIYNKSKQQLSTFGNSKLADDKIGTLFAERLEYNLDKQTILADGKVKFVDKDKNTYYFSKLNSDDKFNEIVGTDINAELNKDLLKSGDKFNEFIEPRFSGKSATLKNNITIVQDAQFTTCKKTNEAEGCAYWNLKAGQLIHDKEQKKLTYKNVSLDLNSIPVIYVPYFSHPDPTVKRKEGFLAPSFSSLGGDIGPTLKIPYFYPLSESADFTVSPVYYFKQNPLLLGEYRERFKNGDLVIEGGYTQGYQKITSTQTDGSRNHLYGNINLNFKDKILDESQFTTKIQRVNDPTYLRVNKINSTSDGFKKNLVRENETKLTNEVSLNSYGNNETLNIKTAAYQNLTAIKTSDQYEYLAPEIIYSKYNFLNNNN
jgi:LPS-assembly protein